MQPRSSSSSSSSGSIWRRLLCTVAVLMVINRGIMPTLATAIRNDALAQNHHDDDAEADDDTNTGTARILSRKRRYLIFPQGSSLQLVYDMVYPILDNANVAYIGITGALAYQLPYEPISIDAIFRRPTPGSPTDGDGGDGGNGGGNGPGQRISDTAADTMAMPTMPTKMSPVDRYYTQNAAGSPSKTTGGTYYIGSPDAPPDRYYKRPAQREPGVIDKASNKMDYYFSYADRLRETLNAMNRQKINPWKRVEWSRAPASIAGSSSRFNAPPSTSASSSFASAPIQHRSDYAGDGFVPIAATTNRRQHAIHPVFGRKKRSMAAPGHHDEADDDVASLTDADRINLNLHRSTRHTLYKRIAKLIDMKRMDGTECVKRALCETSQQRSAGEPDSFLMEIMRAVFSMPLLADIHNDTRHARAADADPQHRLFDEAIATGRLQRDCGAVFGRCEGSIWAAGSGFTAM